MHSLKSLFTLFLLCVHAKRGSRSQAFLAETMETGDKNWGMTGTMHILGRILEKINVKDVELFWNGSVHKFYYRLLCNKRTLQWLKRKKTLRWWGQLVGCCKLSLYTNEYCLQHAVNFNLRWLKWRTMFITFLLSGNDVISLKSRPLIFVFLYSINSETNCWTWYKKYISWRILDHW